ncbi:MAG: MATE family efflux transporter [Myxococcales bacterium]|nr:MATE family efflux transporter [Myxococcales bacterium]
MDGADTVQVGQRPQRAAERVQRIVGLGLPIIGGMISQNILNLVDTAMVGRLGDVALAAVGSASFVNFMLMAWVMGLGTAVQAMASRRVGEGQFRTASVPLNGALLLALVVGLPWSLLTHFGADAIFPLINDSPRVVAEAVPYLEMRVLGIVAVAMNMAFRGYWNAVNLSKLYMRTLIVVHIANVVLNYGLIFGKLGMPQLGTLGAGLGSTIATYIGSCYYLVLGTRHARPAGFLHGLPDGASMRSLLKLALPGGLQQLFFAGGFAALFWILGQVGTSATAAANVLVNVMMVAILPAIALGMAAATLVGQALGSGRADDASAWAWDVAGVAFALLSLLGLPMVFFPTAILGLFIHDPSTLLLAKLPLQIFGAATAFDGIGIVLLSALSGAGSATTVMQVSVALQWGLFLPLAYLLGPVLGHGITAIWIAQSCYRILQSSTFAVIWRRGAWAHVKV